MKSQTDNLGGAVANIVQQVTSGARASSGVVGFAACGRWLGIESIAEVAVSYVDLLRPNKALEPTPVPVMPRASSRVSELKQGSAQRNPARGTPATGVAHL